jgi:hypothetical protein
MNRGTHRACALGCFLLLAAACGGNGGTPTYTLPVGSDDAGGAFAGTDAAGAFDAAIEENHLAVNVITLGCAGACASVEAVATGGNPPYTFVWDDGSTDPIRQVCPTSDTNYSVTAGDTAIAGEFARPPETTKVTLEADVLSSCPDGGGDAGAALAAVVVPGTADLWLAGQPDGTVQPDTGSGGQDVAPAESPAEVPVSAGATLTILATGATSYTGGICYGPSPDGGCIITIDSGPANGVSNLQVLADALVGVFTGAGVPGGQAPAALDFTGSNMSFATLSPLLDQAFFIGDGLTGTGSGAIQRFVVPAGATRLFLGSSDGLGANYNNTGQFSVRVSAL